MAIVDYEYYSDTYLGEPIAESEFPRAEAKAERVITQITHGRAASYAALPAFQQQAVRDAICSQVEYYALMGTDVSINGELAGGWTVGKVRVDSGARAKSSKGSSMVGAAAIAALEQSGLLTPQVETVSDPSILPFIWGYGPC